jgi:outer membrane protein
MKNLRSLFGLLAVALSMTCVCSTLSAAPEDTKVPVIRLINFKNCVEQSKIGKQEQASFEALKKQMEKVLEEKEKVLTDMNTKASDPDYLDSLSPEAETDLKRKFRALSQEIAQLQNQYYQALSQTNVKVLQKLNDIVVKASEKIAQQDKIDFILNEDSVFFYSPKLDITSKVVVLMDESFEKDNKEQTPAKAN